MDDRIKEIVLAILTILVIHIAGMVMIAAFFALMNHFFG